MRDPRRERDSAKTREAASRVIFGKRARPPERDFSFRRERLRIIGAELNLLFAYRFDAAECFASLAEPGACFGNSVGAADIAEKVEPALAIGRSIGLRAMVEIEPQTGFLVLYEGGPGDCVLMTSSEERLLDHIVGLVSGLPAERTPRAADAAADMLIGRTTAEVEQRLILRTLLHCRGNRREAAFALGLDEAELRARLRRIFLAKARASALPEGAQ